jgi:hypothetical protein
MFATVLARRCCGHVTTMSGLPCCGRLTSTLSWNCGSSTDYGCGWNLLCCRLGCRDLRFALRRRDRLRPARHHHRELLERRLHLRLETTLTKSL